MFQKILLGGITLLALGGPLSALDAIDSFVSSRCIAACNQPDNTQCRNCYTTGVELFEQPQSMAFKDLDINPNGGLIIRF
jgi:hypothetical protein